MPPVRPKLSITLPRNFTFHYTDGQDPRERPTNQETETRHVPTPRPYRLRPRQRPGIVLPNSREGQNVSIPLQDVPIPTIETQDTDPSSPQTMNDSIPRLAEGFLAPAPSKPRFFTPPRTPLARIHTTFDNDDSEKTQWEMHSSLGESIRRPESACSGISDSSDSSSDSLVSFPSEGGSCTSPESEDPFVFPGYGHGKENNPASRMTSMAVAHKSQRIRGRKEPGSKHVSWTDEMDAHLWKTYTLYRHDPTVTPFYVQPGGVPPLGVCCRVAREAKRSWKGSKLSLGSIQEVETLSEDISSRQTLRDVQDEANAVQSESSSENVKGIKSGSSTPTAREVQKAALKWPAESLTRRRLRKLCRSKSSPAPHREQLLRPRSTTPYRQPRLAVVANTAFARDMNYSLTTSTSISMRPDSSLAQLARSEKDWTEYQADWFGSPVDRRANQQSQPLQLGLGISGYESMSNRARLGSPFHDMIPDRPSTPQGQREKPKNTPPSLQSPLMLTEPLPYTTAVKRRAQHQLEDELSPGGTGMRVNYFEELFGAPAESSHRRVRSRGFSLGDVSRGSRLSSLITPPALYDQMNSSEFSQAASFQTSTAQDQISSPPLRLGSPFVDDFLISSNRLGGRDQTTPSNSTHFGYPHHPRSDPLGFAPHPSIEQRLEDHIRNGGGSADDRDDSSRKRFKG